MKQFIVNHKFLSIMILVLIGSAAYVGGMLFQGGKAEEPQSTAEGETEQKEEMEPGKDKKVSIENTDGNYIEIREEREVPIEDEIPLSISEYELQNKIHYMSHQKIISSKKWGSLPLTMERVNRLIDILESSTYNNEETYLRILKAWKNKDFSEIDDHHNTIWKMQDGNVGKATGIMSMEEEKEFIEHHYPDALD
ncbi:hypothetical protein GLW05_19565 [Pontibacillus yanchengensis]|uniref:Uncharacterized protein n=1 Tax=Pontibacillus yanchengensis TaxID=462910 RepID=A0A6I5A5X3_9BACI|nr:DUF6241 domain-containing protein [Pontibacillus yanchengensis]MYL35775.1 hypothetical protein [Pontibacillus yanchengensis]